MLEQTRCGRRAGAGHPSCTCPSRASDCSASSKLAASMRSASGLPIENHCNAALRVSRSPNRSSATAPMPSRCCCLDQRAGAKRRDGDGAHRRDLRLCAGRFGDQCLRRRKGFGEAERDRLSASRICTSNRCWVWYFTLPIASAPIAHAPACRPAACHRPSRPDPAMPSGGTAFRSAATFSRLANAQIFARHAPCMPAAAQASTHVGRGASHCAASRSPPAARAGVTPKRCPVARAACSAASRPAAARQATPRRRQLRREHSGDAAHRAPVPPSDQHALPRRDLAVACAAAPPRPTPPWLRPWCRRRSDRRNSETTKTASSSPPVERCEHVGARAARRVRR